MTRAAWLGTALFVVGLGAACRPAAADCKIDDDCANGSRCNDDGKCEAISDGGSTGIDGAAPTGCAGPTNACTADTECCTGRCARGRCASGTGSSSGSSSGTSSGTTSSGAPACQDLYQLCAGDECCPGLTCQSGACR